MIQQATSVPPELYEEDETAWLELTAEVIAQRRFADLDVEHLREYLLDMARRDKREVFNRLVTLLAHLLKWEHQKDHRSNSWRGTIIAQRRELEGLLESGSLRRHAAEILDRAYKRAIEQAAAETGLPLQTFPPNPTSTLDDMLGGQPLA